MELGLGDRRALASNIAQRIMTEYEHNLTYDGCYVDEQSLVNIVFKGINEFLGELK